MTQVRSSRHAYIRPGMQNKSSHPGGNCLSSYRGDFGVFHCSCPCQRQRSSAVLRLTNLVARYSTRARCRLGSTAQAITQRCCSVLAPETSLGRFLSFAVSASTRSIVYHPPLEDALWRYHCISHLLIEPNPSTDELGRIAVYEIGSWGGGGGRRGVLEVEKRPSAEVRM